MARFIESKSDLRRSVINFMKPKDNDKRKNACGSGYKFFVHYKKNGKHLFGLSKFCAFKDISLDQYINELRGTTTGGVTQKHISKTLRQEWLHIDKIPSAIRRDFHSWANSFLSSVGDRDIFLMLID